MHTTIKAIAHVLPDHKLSSIELEQVLQKLNPHLSIPSGIIEQLTGVQSRYKMPDDRYSSTLAMLASQKALEKSWIKPSEIDFMIFACASQDLIEPATANIIQAELKLACPVIDIKNACNSFLSAMEIANQYIINGKYKNIMICSGESLSRVVKKNLADKEELKKAFAGFTLGDCWVAMILGPTTESIGIKETFFHTDGAFREATTVQWGWSRFPQDTSKNYFLGNPWIVRDFFIKLGPKPIDDTLHKAWRSKQELKAVFMHQVSMEAFHVFCDLTQIPQEKLVIILPEYGNIASASIPTALDIALEQKKVWPWDKIMLVGVSAGISIGIILIQL